MLMIQASPVAFGTCPTTCKLASQVHCQSCFETKGKPNTNLGKPWNPRKTKQRGQAEGNQNRNHGNQTGNRTSRREGKQQKPPFPPTRREWPQLSSKVGLLGATLYFEWTPWIAGCNSMWGRRHPQSIHARNAILSRTI